MPRRFTRCTVAQVNLLAMLVRQRLDPTVETNRDVLSALNDFFGQGIESFTHLSAGDASEWIAYLRREPRL